MNKIPASIVIDRQIPEHIRTYYPKFVEFIQTYYKFLDETQLLDIESIHDIDSIDENNSKFIDQILYDKFKFEYARDFPIFAVENKKMLMKHLRDFYLARGSENAYNFLFRVLFNTTANIQYPSSQILRASDGKWSQEAFITINKISTIDFPTNITSFLIEYQNLIREIPVSHFILIDENTLRLYFDFRINIPIKENDKINFVNSDAAGKVILSLKTLIVREDGGTDWQIGQIFYVRGTIKPTICRVTEVGPNGSIKNIEIIEHGYDQITKYNPNDINEVPYDFSYSLETDPNTGVISHLLSIFDSTSKTTDLTTGDISSNSGNFLGMYYGEDYSIADLEDGFYSLTRLYSNKTSGGSTLDTEYKTIKAKLTIVYDVVIKTYGKWTTDDGIISNQNIRLQDNFYYQQFSYVLSTGVNPANYNHLIGSAHPAGLVQFRKYIQEESIDTNIDVQSFMLIDLSFILTENGNILRQDVLDPSDPVYPLLLDEI